MKERRLSRRHRPQRARVWLAAPVRCWAALVDVSNGGLRIKTQRAMTLGQKLAVYREWGGGLGPGREATVVYREGLVLGLSYAIAESADRRGALRHPTRGVSARIVEPVEAAAEVIDMSATGAAIESQVPLPAGARVQLVLVHGDKHIARREAIVVRTRGSSAGVHFVRRR